MDIEVYKYGLLWWCAVSIPLDIGGSYVAHVKSGPTPFAAFSNAVITTCKEGLSNGLSN